MNPNPDNAPDIDTDIESAPADSAAKPARRRRAVKVDTAPTEGNAATVIGGSADDGVGGASAEAQAEDMVAKPKRRRAVAKVEADVSAGVPLQGDSAPAPVAASNEAVSAPAALAISAQDAGDDAPAAGSQGEASDADAQSDNAQGPRSRRRGRRNRGERADRAEGDAGADATSGAEPTETRPPTAPAVPLPVLVAERFAQVLSGEFDASGEPDSEAVVDAVTENLLDAPAEAAEDAAEASPEPSAPKRVLQPEADAPKLHKVLAQSGIGSRRDMEDLIQDGHVTVNGEVAHVGQRVSFGDQVKVNGKPVRLRIVPPTPRIIAYHKPVGEIVSRDDPQNRPSVFRRLPQLQQGKWQSVGRLDINTEGLLLFTTSGELANQLMHPRFGVEREYAVRVLGTLSTEDKAELLNGVDVDGQKASFKSVEDGGGDGANRWYRVVITEGRNREVRRLFEAVDLTVSRLIRIRYGSFVLPLGLKRGVWVDLEDGDVRTIRRLAAGDGGQRNDRGNDRASERGNERGNDRNNDRNNARGGDRQNGPQQNRNDRQQGPRPNGSPNQGERDRNRSTAPQRPRVNEFTPPRVNEMAPPRDDSPRERGGLHDGDHDMDFDPASIPNPLEQTFDKRFVQNPRSPAGGRGFRNGGGGFGAGGSAPLPANKGNRGDPKQPDPLQTSLGFIGADAFHRKGQRGGGGGGQGGGQGGGNRGGGGAGGGGNRGGGGGGGSGGFGGGRRDR